MNGPALRTGDRHRLSTRYETVRSGSQALVAGLNEADVTVQSMPDASPAKWHLAHTTWFFESFVLMPRAQATGYQAFDERYFYLFNSYYEAAGPRHPRPRRGLLTRPSMAEVLQYRSYVDDALGRLLETLDPERDANTLELIELGTHHEQQHQELLLTDILHLFAQNPLRPAFRSPEPLAVSGVAPVPERWIDFEGGLSWHGHGGEGFAFDCETPRHQALLHPYRLCNRTVTNGEWIDFIEDGGYESPLLWLSDGWTTVCGESWNAPLYWHRRDDEWWSMTLRGPQTVDRDAPVTHISYFEADAYARWAGRRLPTEFEWEAAGSDRPLEGNFLDSGRLRPAPAQNPGGLAQMYGDVWEWTASPYIAYPGFEPDPGAVGEYNGKFMCGQFVLRGGSCVTPPAHLRTSYRNFFYPQQRWQFTGLRLAEDAR